jgi:UDP-N-acetylmuramate--alanine ligase
VVLLPIYPAREEPIEGITSQIIADLITVPHIIVERDSLAKQGASLSTDVVVSFGAGNIDACCEDLATVLQQKA